MMSEEQTQTNADSRDTPGQEYHSQALDKYTKANLILFVISVVIVLLDIVGPIVLSGGHDIISICSKWSPHTYHCFPAAASTLPCLTKSQGVVEWVKVSMSVMVYWPVAFMTFVEMTAWFWYYRA